MMNDLEKPQEIPIHCEYLQPWSTFVLKVQMPLSCVDMLIEITDEILERNETSERFGDQLAGEIEDEFIISPKYFENSKKYENILAFINQTSSFYLTNQLCQSNPFKKDVYLNQEWVFKIQSMWTVSQKDNEYNPLHGHGGGRLSAVTWLKIPEYLPDRKNRKNRSDGAITFVGNAQYGHEPNGLCTASFTDYPQVGDFYIFPSPLLHEVYPFRTKDGKGERRSVSMNIDFSNKEKYDNMIKQQNDMEKGIVSGKEGLTRKDRNPWASTGIIPK